MSQPKQEDDVTRCRRYQEEANLAQDGDEDEGEEVIEFIHESDKSIANNNIVLIEDHQDQYDIVENATGDNDAIIFRKIVAEDKIPEQQKLHGENDLSNVRNDRDLLNVTQNEQNRTNNDGPLLVQRQDQQNIQPEEDEGWLLRNQQEQFEPQEPQEQRELQERIEPMMRVNNGSSSSIFRFLPSYRPASFGLMLGLIYYAFRTRRQYYLAVVYLSSSKWAYVVFGNAAIALALMVFDTAVAWFLNGLRIQEAEGLNDFFRWNVTETCLALTMFRSELNVQTALDFVVLVTVKCLHHIASMREKHLRMTQEAIVENKWGYPKIRSDHMRLVAFFVVLQFVDLSALQYTVSSIFEHGPSVSILFAFEAAIMLVSAWSHILLWHLHCLDSILNYGHEKRSDQVAAGQTKHSLFLNACHFSLHTWKEYKATLQFAVQLQAQAVQFLFYITFFGIVLTFYGMPINLFREVYMSFAALKERLGAFLKYRQLMASMNRFDNIESESALEEVGRTCIICRDEMTIYDCKCLPGCRHVFHKSCLREWLVQQQTCPTCRSDIAANETQERARRTAANAAQQREAAESLLAATLETVDGDLEQQQSKERITANEESPNNAQSKTGMTEISSTSVPLEADHSVAAEVDPLSPPAETLSTSTGIDPKSFQGFNDRENTQVLSNQTYEGLLGGKDSSLTQPVDHLPSFSLSTKQQLASGSTDSRTNDAIAGDDQSYQTMGTIASSLFDYDSVKKSVRFLELVQMERNAVFSASHTSLKTRTVSTKTSGLSKRKKVVFPAIFRITRKDGATVLSNFESDRNVLRTIPCGTLVLAQGIVTLSIGSDYDVIDDNIQESARNFDSFIKIPDGWIHRTSVSHEGNIQTRRRKTTIN